MFKLKFPLIKSGKRLTKKRLGKLIIRDVLSKKEREVFEEILFYREKSIAFDFIYKRKVWLEVIPP